MCKISVDKADQNIQPKEHSRGPINVRSKYKLEGQNRAGVKATVSRTRLPTPEFQVHHHLRTFNKSSNISKSSPLCENRDDDHNFSVTGLL